MAIDLIINSILYIIIIFWCTFASADLRQDYVSYVYASHNGFNPVQPGQADLCNLNGPIAPLQGDSRQQVQGIRAQIDYARSLVDNDRTSTDQYRRYVQDNWQNEQTRLGFEHRRECFEHWRENMERLRSEIESRPYGVD